MNTIINYTLSQSSLTHFSYDEKVFLEDQNELLYSVAQSVWDFVSCKIIPFLATSMIAKSPIIPLSIGLLSCSQVEARRGGRPPSVQRARTRKNQIIANQQKHKQNLVSSHLRNSRPNKYIPNSHPNHPNMSPQEVENNMNKLKFNVIKELAERTRVSTYVVSELNKSFGNNWAVAVLEGLVNVALDYTQVTAPINDFKRAINDMEEVYWLDAVLPEYEKIFFEPRSIGWNGDGSLDYSYKIKEMKDKLHEYGYISLLQTPISFIYQLQQRGVCERGGCR